MNIAVTMPKREWLGEAAAAGVVGEGERGERAAARSRRRMSVWASATMRVKGIRKTAISYGRRRTGRGGVIGGLGGGAIRFQKRDLRAG